VSLTGVFISRNKEISMNFTNIEHILYGLLIQVIVAAATIKWERKWSCLTSGNWLAGACLAIGFFFGREHAQWEYKLFIYGQPNTLLPWEGFAFLWKSLDSALDALLPLIACFLVVTGFAVWRSRLRNWI
jgi:ABC-type transport system involved in multi-copper enzyme maturation permease subunit